MFATTTRPTAIPQPHAAPAAGPAPTPGAVRRLRVTRPAARTHRVRRGAPSIVGRRATGYLVRIVGATPPAPVVRIRVAGAHRVAPSLGATA